jgi:hypothetical protein
MCKPLGGQATKLFGFRDATVRDGQQAIVGFKAVPADHGAAGAVYMHGVADHFKIPSKSRPAAMRGERGLLGGDTAVRPSGNIISV